MASSSNTANHPLSGIRVVEFAGLAPGPFAGLILADWGADVIRIDRPPSSSSVTAEVPPDVLARDKRSIAVDPKVPSGLAVIKRLVSTADVLIEPFRPGVMERLGLGPEVFLGGKDSSERGLNEKLVYARLVGFSRTGSHKDIAGHDLNYLALSGVLSLLPGRPDQPSFPLNLLADFAGGGLMCAFGVLLALYERSRSSRGQVVDTDMVSATRYISSFALINSFTASTTPSLPTQSVSGKDASSRMQNLLDGGAPFYAIYTCTDGKCFSVACLEPRFYKVFLEAFLAALPSEYKSEWVPTLVRQHRREEWSRLREFLERGFRLYDRAHWTKVFQGKDACAVPVLTPHEASILMESDASPPPHPRLTRTPAKSLPAIPATATAARYSLQPGADTEVILNELGYSDKEQELLARDGALGRLHCSAKL
ncbi:hypothetical protein EIP91_009056 [Steccherinum ochraceum]|uniref:Alpha-methylacyl-CoA racemase n=1 Tax=Steccherinum ochraceum TaxID=92696 RepID=A0A4R0R235_9APHY|nr:hypothetical protein EIP91_009056 [Steccherinum ochraceum]